ncbi:MAG: hypothetical protein GWN01_11775, partial [Nitrosopumilaceae archaeon]|nr:hypothetical protein [Nitrosopumilaceae archaeon]NIU01554.1 hypothetical protein [Nitrosopumilaceae archaeon]NIV66245.1 hypothetical protein [Nitrosopumilaceae archaeon]NIX62156.1 hypothetical protein [Nitrosopumilaceae archaeon]
MTTLVAVLVLFVFIISFSLSQANAEQEIDSKNLSGLESTHSPQLESEKKALPEFKSEDKNQRPLSHTKFSSLQVPFIKNEGQVDDIVYYANTFAGTVFVTKGGLTYSIPTENLKAADMQFDLEKNSGLSAPISVAVIREEFVTTKNLQPSPHQRSKTAVNYFAGKEENWRTNISTFDSVDLGEVFPNVDVRLKAHGNNVEKIFEVKPGGNPDYIRMAFEGINGLGVSDTGKLLIETDLGTISMSKPVAYQYIDGVKRLIDVSYEVGSNSYGFLVNEYDPNVPLVIDPLLASTFVGGSSQEIGIFISLDSSGNVFVTGQTTSSDFPTTSAVYDENQNNNRDVFVSKISNDLSGLSASTFLGGTNFDTASSLSLDSADNVFVTGRTGSSDFPTTTNAYDQILDDFREGYVSKLSNDLSTLSASTFLGGSSSETGRSLSLDSADNVFVTGETLSSDFPTTAGSFDQNYGGRGDVFVSKLSNDLSTLSSSTFIGGSEFEFGLSLFLDSTNNVFVTGRTTSFSFPTTAGSFDQNYGGSGDVFVSKLSNDLSTLSSSTFIGGSRNERGSSVSLDSADNVFVVGGTSSSDFPTTSGSFDQNHGGSFDVFVSKLSNDLSTLSASTFLGGSSSETGRSLSLDSADNVFVTGQTVSSNFPTTAGA